jgi:hypothetical protein
MLSRQRLHGGDRLDLLVESHDLPLQMDSPFVGMGQCQEFTDEATKPLGFGMNRAKDAHIVVWGEDLQERQVGFAASDGDWRTQLVGGIRDKASLAQDSLLMSQSQKLVGNDYWH